MNVLDIARGAYVRSPRFVRTAASPLIQLLPTSLLYGRRYRRWRQDIERSHHDGQYVQGYQVDALRRLIGKAHSGSSFYRALIDRTYGPQFDLTTFQISDLSRMPVLTKDILRDIGEQALAAPKSSVDKASTSGSSGKPLIFYLDKNRSIPEIAFGHSVWSRTGFEAGHTRCVIREFAFPDPVNKPYEWEPSLKELRFSSLLFTPANLDRYLDLLDEYEIRYIHAYPSAVEILCRHMQRSGRRLKQSIKAVFAVSEALYSYQRDIYQQTLGDVQIVPLYGMSERTLFAGEVNGEPDVYEFEPLYGYAELLDDDDNPITQPGQTGRLIGTSFLSMGQPFIRYDTSDIAELVEAPRIENQWRLRVTRLTSHRAVEFLVGADNSLVPFAGGISVTDSAWHPVSEVQYYQDTPGKCIIKVVPAKAASQAALQKYVDALSEKVGTGITMELKIVDTVASLARGKRMLLDQRIDLSNFSVVADYHRRSREASID